MKKVICFILSLFIGMASINSAYLSPCLHGTYCFYIVNAPTFQNGLSAISKLDVPNDSVWCSISFIDEAPAAKVYLKTGYIDLCGNLVLVETNTLYNIRACQVLIKTNVCVDMLRMIAVGEVYNTNGSLKARLEAYAITKNTDVQPPAVY